MNDVRYSAQLGWTAVSRDHIFVNVARIEHLGFSLDIDKGEWTYTASVERRQRSQAAETKEEQCSASAESRLPTQKSRDGLHGLQSS